MAERVRLCASALAHKRSCCCMSSLSSRSLRRNYYSRSFFSCHQALCRSDTRLRTYAGTGLAQRRGAHIWRQQGREHGAADRPHGSPPRHACGRVGLRALRGALHVARRDHLFVFRRCAPKLTILPSLHLIDISTRCQLQLWRSFRREIHFDTRHRAWCPALSTIASAARLLRKTEH